MVQAAERKRQRYAEKKARAGKGLLTPKEAVQREKERNTAKAWRAADPKRPMARDIHYNSDREVPFMLPSSTSRHCLYQRSKKRQRITLGPENGRASAHTAQSATMMMAFTPKANLLPEMLAMFDRDTVHAPLA